MGGCTNCKSKPGCDDRKGDMMSLVDEVLARAYPSRTWGEPDDAALLDGGVSPDDGAALAEELAVELDAAAFYVPGAPEELCDYVHVLCLGRTPCILQVRDLGADIPDEWDPGSPIIERYLRIALSSVARVAAVQEVALEAHHDRGGWLFRERPRGGVYDAPLLKRFQRLVAILPAYDLTHLDFGEIAAAPPGFHPGAWAASWGGGEPAIANYLFFPHPPSMESTVAATMARTCSTTR